MKKLLMILPLVFLLCLTFSCEQGEEVDIEADVKVLKALLDERDALYSAGNTEGIVSLYYAEDAVRMPPEKPMLKGKAAILEEFKIRSEHYTYKPDNVVEDVQVNGDLAFMRGTLGGTVTPKAEVEPFQQKGKWMAVYKRQVDGSWKCIADIYNRDHPSSEGLRSWLKEMEK